MSGVLCSAGSGLVSTGSTGAANVEMISRGACDAFTIKNPTATLWKQTYARITNFATEAVGQNFQNQPAFGTTVQLTLNKVGQMIYHQYLLIDLPGIKACPIGDRQSSCVGSSWGRFPVEPEKAAHSADQAAYRNSLHCGTGCNAGGLDDSVDNLDDSQARDYYMKKNYGACPPQCDESSRGSIVACNDQPWCHWANAIGQLIIKRAALTIGQHQVDVVYSDYLYHHEELTGQAGKRLTEMIGKRTSRRQLIADASKPQRLYVPLPWFFTQKAGMAFSICGAQFNGVQIYIEFEQLSKCVVVSDSDVEVRVCCTGELLTSSSLKNALLLTTYVHLDIEEKNMMSLANQDILIKQVQALYTTSKNSSCVSIPIKFNHPVLYLSWAVRRSINERRNNWFNYSGIGGLDPLVDVALRVNNLARFSGNQGSYYRLVVPWEHFSSIPQGFIYAYSFADAPEDTSPTGSINFSRIDNVDMTFYLQPGLECEMVTIMLFAVNFNVIRFTDGLVGLLFQI